MIYFTLHEISVHSLESQRLSWKYYRNISVAVLQQQKGYNTCLQANYHHTLPSNSGWVKFLDLSNTVENVFSRMMFNTVHNQNVAASCIKYIWPTNIALPLLETNKQNHQPAKKTTKKKPQKKPNPTTTITKKTTLNPIPKKHIIQEQKRSRILC